MRGIAGKGWPDRADQALSPPTCTSVPFAIPDTLAIPDGDVCAPYFRLLPFVGMGHTKYSSSYSYLLFLHGPLYYLIPILCLHGGPLLEDHTYILYIYIQATCIPLALSPQFPDPKRSYHLVTPLLSC
jgi:hypothetical protein